VFFIDLNVLVSNNRVLQVGYLLSHTYR